jgi:hypothetical protein
MVGELCQHKKDTLGARDSLFVVQGKGLTAFQWAKNARFFSKIKTCIPVKRE